MKKFKVTHVEGITEMEGKHPLVVFTTNPAEVTEELTFQEREGTEILFVLVKGAYEIPDEVWLGIVVPDGGRPQEDRDWLQTLDVPFVAWHRCPLGGFYQIEPLSE